MRTALPSVNFKIHSTPKSETLASDYKQSFNEINNLIESIQFGCVYTDGSKFRQQFPLLIF